MRKYFVSTDGESPALIASAFTKDVVRGRTHKRAENMPWVLTGTFTEAEVESMRDRGAEVTESRRYDPLLAPLDRVFRPLPSHPHSMADVMKHINAPAAWAKARGKGVHIAIIDTGICGRLNEFPTAKRSKFQWVRKGGDAWTDPRRHGSMTAAVAAATTAGGGRYDGVAPDATVISCKAPSFDETDLFRIYDFLLSLVKTGKIGRLVTNNSYGAYTCRPVTPARQLAAIIRQAVAEGIVTVFAAGNNHVSMCRGVATDCTPNTIWGLNSFDEVLSVGTVNQQDRMSDAPLVPNAFSHRDSSRGPGEHAVATSKPDCVAPTYGEVVWGCGYQAMEWWGTSGAAPQVAGLAALILELKPSLSATEVYDVIRNSCVDIGLGATCAGRGRIDCAAALQGL